MEEEKITYLTSDDEIRNQKFVCLSIITPEIVKNCKVRAIKIRGVYNTEEEAKNRCKELNKIDPDFNIYIAPVGCWVPWCDDPDKADDCEYANEELNNLMKAYKENQIKAKMLHENRKQDMIEKNMRESEERKKKNENERKKIEENADEENTIENDTIEENTIENDTIEENTIENDTIKIDKNITPDEIERIENQIKEKEEKINNDRDNLNIEKNKLNEDEKMKKHIQDEIKRAKELYDKLS